MPGAAPHPTPFGGYLNASATPALLFPIGCVHDVARRSQVDVMPPAQQSARDGLRTERPPCTWPKPAGRNGTHSGSGGGDSCYGERRADRVDPTCVRAPVHVCPFCRRCRRGGLGVSDRTMSRSWAWQCASDHRFGADGPLRNGLGAKRPARQRVRSHQWSLEKGRRSRQLQTTPIRCRWRRQRSVWCVTLPPAPSLPMLGNDLLGILANGALRVLATFPPTFVDAAAFWPSARNAVPWKRCHDGRARPDGARMSATTAFPFVVGAAISIAYRAGRYTRRSTPGFTNIIDLAFDASARSTCCDRNVGAAGTPGR